MKTYSDEQLVIDYLKGNEKSLEVLIKRYLKPIYSFVFRYVGNEQEVEDITQEVFIKVWKNLKKFDPHRQNKKPAPYRTNEVSSGSGFKTWIFVIAKNTAIDWLKKKKVVPLPETLVDSRPLPDKLFEQANVEEMLNTTMAKLSPSYRMVLFLRYNDHFTFREIAESLGESVNTIKTRHRRGIAILRKLLKKK